LDDCSRTSLKSWVVKVLSSPAPPMAVDDNLTAYPGNLLYFNALNNDYDPNENLDSTTFTPTSALVVAGKGEFVDNGSGNLVFVPEGGFTSGSVQLTYQVCDANPNTGCDTATITITIDTNPCPGGTPIEDPGYNATSVFSDTDWKDQNNATGNNNTSFAKAEQDNADIILYLGAEAKINTDIIFNFSSDKGKEKTLDIWLCEDSTCGGGSSYQLADDITISDKKPAITQAIFNVPAANYDYVRVISQKENLLASVEYSRTGCATGPDNDGDGIIDSIDIDDDNDGIIDTIEQGCFTPTSATGATAFGPSGVADIAQSYDGIIAGDNGAGLNRVGEGVVLNLGGNVVSGSTISVHLWTNNSNDDREIDISQSTDATAGSNLSNTVSVRTPGTPTQYSIDYILTSDASYLEIEMTERLTGKIEITELQIYSGTNCNTTLDFDNDGVYDYFDLDSDGDGIPDNIEAQSTLGYIAPSGIFGDNGLDSAYEVNDLATASGLTPVNTDGEDNPDYLDLNSDNEGDNDMIEAGLSPLSGTVGANGLDTNSDRTGFDNYVDVNGRFDNTQADNWPESDNDVYFGGDVDWRDVSTGADADEDGIFDDIDIDDDNDGITDIVESGGNEPDGDEDGDGIENYRDTTDNGTGDGSVTNYTDTNSDGIPDVYDFDDDGVPNHLDLDTDNDGIPDNIEAQPTVGYVAPSGSNDDIDDTNNNGLDDIYESSPGVGLDPYNKDQTDNPDYKDLDSDNEGSGDRIEAGITLTGVVGSNGLYTSQETSDGYADVNGIYDTSQTDNFPDEDGDVLSNGDVDWRDNFLGSDNDNDGINDTDDLDDDNDGIVDTIESNGSDPSADHDFDGTANWEDVDFCTLNAQGVCANMDNDSDGIPNHFDLDSDGDGCTDTLEATIPTSLTNSNVYNGVPNTITDTNDAIVTDTFGSNGFAASLESDDTENATPSFANTTTNYNTYALDNTKKACGVPMITQVYHSTTDKWIEITNRHAIAFIPPSAINVILYTDKSGDQTDVALTFSLSNTSQINPGESILFKNTGAAISNINNSVTPVANNSLATFDGGNDIITVSRSITNSKAWPARIDVVESFNDNTCYVRIDETLEENKNYSSSEWVAFIDDALLPYRLLEAGGPQRHPHDSLLSEITSSNSDANTLLGLHRFDITYRNSSTWSNGFPDRSRYVVVNNNYEHTGSRLSARKLDVSSSKKLTITNQLLVVTNDINLSSATDEIRLSGNAQLVQTHTSSKKVGGSGKLYVDQNSTVPSLYRYNYMSSPVNSSSSVNYYKFQDVIKDGTDATDSDSTPLNINFIGGYDGNHNQSPIELADYWIYTYATGDGNRSNWEHKYKDGQIPQTDGFIFKGPGQLQNYTFVGSPKDGTFSTAQNIGGYDTYLVGNPYPSALNANKFIEDNINSITGTLYFWEHGESAINETSVDGHAFAGYTGGYATLNRSMGVAANNPQNNSNDNNGTSGLGQGAYNVPLNYIAIGQGFFIGGDSDGGSVTFNNSQREYVIEGPNSIFLKQKKKSYKIEQETERPKIPIIKLGMGYTNDEGIEIHRQIGVSFSEFNSFGFDKGFDSSIYDVGETDIYWEFENDEDKYVIAGVQEIADQLEIPLSISIAESQDVSLTIDEWQSIDRDVFVKDLLTGNQYKVNNETAIVPLEAGVHKDRFVLGFAPKNTGVTKSIIRRNLKINYKKKQKVLVLTCLNDLELEKVRIIDIFGAGMYRWNKLDSTNKKHRFNVSKLKTGLYILRVKTNYGVMSKKIFIH
jgi:hypothetical protein